IQGVIGADCARHCIHSLAGLGLGLRDLQHQEAVEKGTGGTAHAEGESRQAQDQVNHNEAQGAAALQGAEGSQGHDPRPERREATTQPVQRRRPSPRGRWAGAVVGQDPDSEGRLHHEEQPRVVERGGHLGGGHHGFDPGPCLEARQGAPARADGPQAHVVSLMGDGGRGLPAADAAVVPEGGGAVRVRAGKPASRAEPGAGRKFWLNGIPLYPKLCSQHEWPHEQPAQH
ncbi:hypothetical protein E2I00_012849, partial [Balaenoptera physalus]